MIKKFVLTLYTSSLFGFSQLPEEYLVTFGDPEAQMEFVQYYSLSCPHCVQIFKNDFGKVQEQYIEKGYLRYVFHPIPMDLTTVQFMCCLEKLNQQEKQLFLRVLLEELSLDNPGFNVQLMKGGMEILKKPLSQLEDETFIKESNSFSKAKDFITQEDSINTVPSIQIGDRLIEKTPDYSFISMIMDKLVIQDSQYDY